jgi:hypothetical protein
MKSKNEYEEMQHYILQHMIERDKHNLLMEREPIPMKKKKLQFYLA